MYMYLYVRPGAKYCDFFFAFCSLLTNPTVFALYESEIWFQWIVVLLNQCKSPVYIDPRTFNSRNLKLNKSPVKRQNSLKPASVTETRFGSGNSTF